MYLNTAIANFRALFLLPKSEKNALNIPTVNDFFVNRKKVDSELYQTVRLS